MTGTATGAAAPPGVSTPVRWRLRGRVLDTDRPLVMGILNVTPDSFSDGGRYLAPERAVERATELVEAGADIVDIGGESTRPGARGVGAEEEWARIGPVFRALEGVPVPLSVDTTKAAVAARALEAGAAVVNDVSGLRFEPELAEVAAESGAGLVLMHMRGEPRTMQEDVEYEDLIGEVREALGRSVERALRAGCAPEQLVVDPGIGFGKSVDGNLELLRRLDAFAELGRPILVGPSRKSFLGRILDLPPEDRVEGTVAACLIALERGAAIFRVHDVAAVRRALDVASAIRRGSRDPADSRPEREAAGGPPPGSG